MRHFPRAPWAILLVFLHLIVAPCAMAMQLMSSNADCEHCQTTGSPDACVAASAAMGSVIEGVAFDSGRAEPPVQSIPVVCSAPSSRLVTADVPLRTFTLRHTGDPPLYLIFGQLRI